ncbi:uncharacterized protein B0I36DRAFT_234147 [Microdochium trichocladiopsis]|uniref:Zn(2)-C6 fungal-type domain-containing protein n=1 Tax=Microdochium trichocladiopsis TaxID=1682393 RepID=A0A9P8YM67_9PEZI|nr:uncharacterized protein B0I36DRAFT_234147 [Microdochium trichocladiopsis]KAH7041589.1 hypothetical protein B0I36DRAFT_234147 [Microdochium trichocladiopsis]
MRTSQRQPKSCLECTRRKIRCDKGTPCARCVRLGKQCARELVQTTRAVRDHQDEIVFLEGLAAALAEVDGTEAIRATVRGRIGELAGHNAAAITTSSQVALTASVSDRDENGALPGSSSSPTGTVSPSAGTGGQTGAALHTVEFMAWGRHRGACFPHRSGCDCRMLRPYAEIASINTDLEWTGLRRTIFLLDPDLQLDPDHARALVRLHFDHVLWHHNAFHAPTFLAQCEEFWEHGTVVHPLWMALYFSVLSVTLWTVLNSELPETEYLCDEPAIRRYLHAMLQTLYQENFLENQSLFSIQAIAISTRVAHNLGLSDLNAALVGAAVRIAHLLGLHQIQPALDRHTIETASDWFSITEEQVGCRTWLQLTIQDHFQVFFTETYLIHPWHFKTPMPLNCNDEDMIELDNETPTINSYIRTLGGISRMIPSLLDALGPMNNRRPLDQVYRDILTSDQAFRDFVKTIPSFLLKDAREQGVVPPWQQVAKASLAITSADKIIMIHRPILFHSFQNPAFAWTRATCVAAALTILHQQEETSSRALISMWTHSAFCITAAVVIGLELLHHTSHTGTEAQRLRVTLAKAAGRLRRRRCDVIAERGAALIDTMLAIEEELVINMMRASSQGVIADETRHAMINQMIENNQILARLLALAPGDLTKETQDWPAIQVDPNAHAAAFSFTGSEGAEIDSWFSQVFSIDHDLF